jgi:hypothetical protein
MATITWSINSMVIVPQVDQYTDYAWQVGWTCTATDNGNTKSISSSLTFYPSQQGQPYVPYDQLTEAQVISWVQAALGPEKTAQTESVVTNLLTAQPAPLPWGN